MNAECHMVFTLISSLMAGIRPYVKPVIINSYAPGHKRRKGRMRYEG